MKALTVWEPWASLMACGRKNIETRSWPTNYRGPLLICAAKRKVKKELLAHLKEWEIQNGLAPLKGLNDGPKVFIITRDASALTPFTTSISEAPT